LDNYFTYNSFSLHYIEFGKGDEVLIVFPGFGRQPDDFLLFEDLLKEQYRVIAISHFHHGKSLYPDKRIHKHQIKMHEIEEMFSAFFKQKNIQRFSLMGYSLGAKLSLCLLQLFPDKINSLYLFAPDGVKTNAWYSIVSKTFLGRGLYTAIIYFPYPFHAILKLLYKSKIIGTRLYKFVYNQTDTLEKRLMVLKVWLTYKRLNPEIKTIQHYILKNKINTHLFFGRYDKVIPPSIGKSFIMPIKKQAHLHIIYVGHNLICAKTHDYIAKHPTVFKKVKR
jgi:pimeloyl-ACP methyl ester carboxylesterase